MVSDSPFEITLGVNAAIFSNFSNLQSLTHSSEPSSGAPGPRDNCFLLTLLYFCAHMIGGLCSPSRSGARRGPFPLDPLQGSTSSWTGSCRQRTCGSGTSPSTSRSRTRSSRSPSNANMRVPPPPTPAPHHHNPSLGHGPVAVCGFPNGRVACCLVR